MLPREEVKKLLPPDEVLGITSALLAEAELFIGTPTANNGKEAQLILAAVCAVNTEVLHNTKNKKIRFKMPKIELNFDLFFCFICTVL